MPPRKKPAAAAPVSPVRMAANYAGSPITSTAKPTKKTVNETWTKALAEIIDPRGGNYWAVAHGVEWVARNPGDSLVVFHGDVTADPVARFKVSVLQDEGTRARVAKQIILGFAGGRFTDDRGEIVATVTGFVSERNKITKVQFTVSLEMGSDPIGPSQVLPVGRFLQDFPRGAEPSSDAGGGEGDEDTFDFTPYKETVEVLRALGVLSPSLTMPVAAAITYLDEALEKKGTLKAAGLAKAAAEYERMAAERSSPECKRLKRVRETGYLDVANMQKAAGVARKLALGAGASGKEAPPPPATSKPKKAPPPPKRKERAEVVADSDSDENDSESGSSDDEADEEEAGSSGKKGAGGTAGSSKEHKRKPEAKRARGEEPFGLLAQLTPKGMRPIDTASIIFSHDRLCNIVGTERLDRVDVRPEEVYRFTRRYAYALERLMAADETFTMRGDTMQSDVQTAARSRTDLEDWAEQLLNAVVSAPTEGGASAKGARAELTRQSQATASRERSSLEEGSSSKPEPELSAEKKRGAVSAAVAARLHNATSEGGRVFLSPKINEYAVAAEGGKASLAPLISEAPECLRADLQRALVSNGSVQAAGETLHARRALPVAVISLRYALRTHAEQAIWKIPRADTTGMLQLTLATVTATATKTADLSATWGDFVAVAKEMGGTRAAAADTAAGNTEAWSIMHAAYQAVLRESGLDGDSGLATINQRHTTTLGAAQLPPKELAQWTSRVFQSYHEQAYNFRGGGELKPSLQVAVQSCEQHYNFTAMSHALGRGPEAAATTSGAPAATEGATEAVAKERGRAASPKTKERGRAASPKTKERAAARRQRQRSSSARRGRRGRRSSHNPPSMRCATRRAPSTRRAARSSSSANAAAARRVTSRTRARTASPTSWPRTASPSRATRWRTSVRQRTSNLRPCTLRAHASLRTSEPAARAARVPQQGAARRVARGCTPWELHPPASSSSRASKQAAATHPVPWEPEVGRATRKRSRRRCLP